jgi:hypothetical protein
MLTLGSQLMGEGSQRPIGVFLCLYNIQMANTFDGGCEMRLHIYFRCYVDGGITYHLVSVVEEQ